MVMSSPRYRLDSPPAHTPSITRPRRRSGAAAAITALLVLGATPAVASGTVRPVDDGKSGQQSPIDLPPQPPSNAESHRVSIFYGRTSEHLIHRDHAVEVEYDPGSSIEFDGATYQLIQIHFHTPSEHLIGHDRYPVELHLVHRDQGGRLLVLGILFETGAPNAFVERILSDAPADLGRVDLESQLDVSKLFPAEKHFYTYLGSLTTAPYTEGVRWLVLAEHPTLSPEQVVRLLVLEGGNARDVQPIVGHPIDGF